MKFGSALTRLGGKRGDVMGMVSGDRRWPFFLPFNPCSDQVLPNIPEFPIAFLGAAGAGITVTTANPTYRSSFATLTKLLPTRRLFDGNSHFRAEEVARQFELSGAKFVVTLAMFLPNVKQVGGVDHNV